MSYFATSPSQFMNIAPFDADGDFRVPVPGWGKAPRASGPARVGIGVDTRTNAEKVNAWGASFAKALTQGDPTLQACLQGGSTLAQCTDVQASKNEGFPWWGYIAIPAGVGTALAVGMWWYGKKK